MREVDGDETKLDALLDAAARQLAADGRPRVGDQEIMARAIEAAIAEGKTGRSRGLGLGRRQAGRVALLAAALLVAASVAFALIERGWSIQRTAKQPQSLLATPEPSPARPIAPSARPIEERTEKSTSEAPATHADRSSPPPSPELTSQELFAQANETRRHGDGAAAVRQYLALQRRFPRSPEASMSLVALGRLYLDRLGDPARALAQFDEYLTGAGDGELNEEALVGRAIALQRLGRTAEEKSAWRALLAAFPNSLSAGRATARLAELH